MGDTSADLIDLSSIEPVSPSPFINSVATMNDHHHHCDSIKTSSIFKVHQSQPLLDESTNEGFTSRRTKERIDEFEAQLECFIKTKKLLLEQFNEETQNLIQKHERDILGLRQKHLVCENNFKSQLENASHKIKNLETKMESEQTSLKLKIEFYEEEFQKNRQDAKIKEDKLEKLLNEKEKQNDELKKQNLNLESQLNLLNSEYKNRRHQFEDKIREYEMNQEKDAQEIKNLRDELNSSFKDISILQRDLDDIREILGKKESQYLILEEKLEKYKNQIQIESELKKESVDRIQAMKETLKVSQNENEILQTKLTETQTRMTEEIEKLKSNMNIQKSNYEQRFRRLFEEKIDLENKFKAEISVLEKSLEDSKKQCDDLKEELQKTFTEKHKMKHQLETQMEKLTSEKQSMELSFNTHLNDLNKKVTEMEQKLKNMNEKYELTQNELIKAQNYISGVENDLKSKNSEILNVHEKYNLLEMDRLSLLSEIENIKRLSHLESVEKKEKLRQVEELNESLSSSQIEIEKLKNVNEQLKRSLEDGDNLRFSVIKDCNELRETLSEVEKSRLEIKSKLNSCQFNCASLNNQIKKRDLEIEDLKRKLNSYDEEKKFWRQDLDSTSQSLTQMKTAYERLYQQNVLLQNKLSQLESETKSIEVKNSPNSKETIKKLSQECEQSRERIAKLESEKKHFERSYVNMEREYNNLKNSFNPNNSKLVNTGSSPLSSHKSTDHCSVLSLTQLLKHDLSNVNPFSLDDTNRSLETLIQKNNELKQKVLGKQNPEKKINSKLSDVDFCECLYYNQNHKNDSNNNNHLTNNNFLYELEEPLDENRNVEIENDNSFDEKLKLAELNAQKVLDSCEPEVRKLSKTRIKSAYHKYPINNVSN